MQHRRTHARNAGLTLAELLIGLAIAGVVAAIGVPALQAAALNAQRMATVNGLASLIQFARSAAQSRSNGITLCKVDATERCSSGGARWIVADASTGAALRVLETNGVRHTRSNRSAFEFRPFPHRSTNGTILYCDPRGGTAPRAVVISTAGRARIVTPTEAADVPTCAP